MKASTIKNKIKCSAMIFLLIVFVFTTVANAADGKIGVLDFEKILRTSKAVRDIRGLFLLKVERIQGQLQADAEKIQKEKSDFIQNQMNYSDAQKRRLQSEFEQKTANLKKKQSEVNRKLKEEDIKLMRDVRTDIHRIANSFLEKNRFRIIVDRKFVFAAETAADVTEEITRLYDAEKGAR